jgi:hypothetical protein
MDKSICFPLLLNSHNNAIASPYCAFVSPYLFASRSICFSIVVCSSKK